MFEMQSLTTMLRWFVTMSLMFLFFTSFNQVYAISICCAEHGGVAKCDSAVGFQICKDGFQSKCACEKAKENDHCCAGHGGVEGCNKGTGYQLCKDGTTSPKCKCKELTR